MLRKMMLAGLMAATLLSGVAPAYAQNGQEQRGDRGGDRGDRGGRPDGGAPRGDGPGRPDRGQGWQQRGPDRPAPQMGARPDARPDNRPDQRPDGRPNPQWRNDQNRPGPSQPVAPRPDNRPGQRDDRAQNWQGRGNGQPDWRNDGRNDRPDWRNNPRDGRPPNWSNRGDDRRNDGRGDPRWNGNAGRPGGGSWNDGRRFDDRTRWSQQRRWDNGWRQDRRYDWNSYRNRYGDRYRMGRYNAPRGWDYGYRRFSVGIVLNRLLYSNSYWLDDPYSYRLPPAYGTLRWVRYYDDAMLVDIRDGYVVDVIHDFFW
jgi:hypothetical protein